MSANTIIVTSDMARERLSALAGQRVCLPSLGDADSVAPCGWIDGDALTLQHAPEGDRWLFELLALPPARASCSMSRRYLGSIGSRFFAVSMVDQLEVVTVTTCEVVSDG